MKKRLVATIIGLVVLCVAGYGGYWYLKPPLVSVTMLTYRRADILPQAIESILNQTSGDFELIILNDGSPDNTDEVVARYKDSRIRYYKNDRNRGIAYSRNRVTSLARGKYIMVMDDDDISYVNRLEKQSAYLEAHPEIDVVAGQMKGHHIIIPEDHDEIVRNLLIYNVISNGNVMYRRSFAEKHHIRYNEEYQSSEDWDYWIQFLFAGAKFHGLPDYAIIWNMTSNKEYKVSFEESNVAVYKKIASYFIPENPDAFMKISNCDRVKVVAAKNLMSREYMEMAYEVNCLQPSQAAAE